MGDERCGWAGWAEQGGGLLCGHQAGQPRQRGLPQTRLPPSGAGNKTSCMEEAGARGKTTLGYLEADLGLSPECKRLLNRLLWTLLEVGPQTAVGCSRAVDA